MRAPRRVVVDAAGHAVGAHLAKAEYNIMPDIVFVRKDGWTLGSPKKFEAVAYQQWADEWISFYREGDHQLSPIEEYKERN